MIELTIKEAAERLGVSADTVRRHLKSGELEGRREPMGSGYRWIVQLDEDLEPEPQAATGTAVASAEALELADARARIEGLERLIDELAADRDHWREHAHRSQVMAETAQRLAERAQALALPSGGAETGAASNHAGAETQTPSGSRESLLARLSRALRIG
jgi:excisionase family DNA binding protein